MYENLNWLYEKISSIYHEAWIGDNRNGRYCVRVIYKMNTLSLWMDGTKATAEQYVNLINGLTKII